MGDQNPRRRRELFEFCQLLVEFRHWRQGRTHDGLVHKEQEMESHQDRFVRIIVNFVLSMNFFFIFIVNYFCHREAVTSASGKAVCNEVAWTCNDKLVMAAVCYDKCHNKIKVCTPEGKTRHELIVRNSFVFCFISAKISTTTTKDIYFFRYS